MWNILQYQRISYIHKLVIHDRFQDVTTGLRGAIYCLMYKLVKILTFRGTYIYIFTIRFKQTKILRHANFDELFDAYLHVSRYWDINNRTKLKTNNSMIRIIWINDIYIYICIYINIYIYQHTWDAIHERDGDFSIGVIWHHAIKLRWWRDPWCHLCGLPKTTRTFNKLTQIKQEDIPLPSISNGSHGMRL